MRNLQRCSLFLFLAVALRADSVTITNQIGTSIFVNLDIDGTNYSALDYTDNRFVSWGETWDANLYTLNDLSTEPVYYGPADPQFKLSNYQDVYYADVYLFQLAISTPSEQPQIQAAVYAMSLGNDTSALAQQALNAVSGFGYLSLGNLSQYVAVDAPFPLDQTIGLNLAQGFLIEEPCTTCSIVATPEPSTRVLLGSGFLLIGFSAFTRSLSRRGLC